MLVYKIPARHGRKERGGARKKEARWKIGGRREENERGKRNMGWYMEGGRKELKQRREGKREHQKEGYTYIEREGWYAHTCTLYEENVL